MGQVLYSGDGVQVRRVIDRAGGVAPEHGHDWPVLSLFVMGGYRNSTELGDLEIAGPSAVLYGAGAAHANRAGGDGFEQLEIEFDPDWLGAAVRRAPPVTHWLSGQGATAARRLAQACLAGAPEPQVRQVVQGFVERAGYHAPLREPAWLRRVEAMLRDDPSLAVSDLAWRVGRHPAWLGVAYARHRGESLPQAAARLRVERAARLLRESDEAPAQIAASAGFCDQSHMLRVFRRILGRAPSDIRADRAFLRAG